ncbi:MAG: hypothetical protein CMK59_13205 [Proteobacteria bacterium]|nr:hypothetical protein [Pseudomonadota bacterium]
MGSLTEQFWTDWESARWSILPIVALAAVYFWSCGLDPMRWIFGPTSKQIMQLGALSSAHVDRGEIWRLGASLILHGDLLHLSLNLSALWILGGLTEAAFGLLRSTGIALGAGLSGAVLSWSIGARQTVGFSGALFGLLCALVIFGWKYRVELGEDISQMLGVRLAILGVLNLTAGFLLPMVDNPSHLGGALMGLVLGMLFSQKPDKSLKEEL